MQCSYYFFTFFFCIFRLILTCFLFFRRYIIFRQISTRRFSVFQVPPQDGGVRGALRRHGRQVRGPEGADRQRPQLRPPAVRDPDRADPVFGAVDPGVGADHGRVQAEAEGSPGLLPDQH